LASRIAYGSAAPEDILVRFRFDSSSRYYYYYHH